jgi:hypothetical protein
MAQDGPNKPAYDAKQRLLKKAHKKRTQVSEAKDETEEGITGQPIPKRNLGPAKRHEFEKKRREARKERNDPRAGDSFSQHRMTGSRGRGSEYQNTRSIREELLSYLLDEGFASDEKSAEAIMGAMSEAWVESIVEEVLDEAVRGSERSIADRITGNDIRKVTRGNKEVYKKPRWKDDVENQVRGGSQLRKSGETENTNDRRDRERIETNRKSIQNLNAKSGQDSGDYDGGHHGDDDTSGGKHHYSLSHTNHAARRRRASGR